MTCGGWDFARLSVAESTLMLLRIIALSPACGAYGLLPWKTGVAATLGPQAASNASASVKNKIFLNGFILSSFDFFVDDIGRNLFPYSWLISSIQMYGALSDSLVILVFGVPVSMVVVKFSRYEIRAELGVGAMATVYRAYDPMFEREVALKILKKDLLEDTQLKERFERETKIIARLEHAYIVPVYNVGLENGQLFYVMRYMAGGSLSERIEQGLTPNEIAHILLRTAAALDYAHGKGVVHRDLKTGNIRFDGKS